MDLKGEMEAGDLTVFRTTEGSPGDDTRVKLRTRTFRKSARNWRSREFYFDFWGNIVCSIYRDKRTIKVFFTIG